MMTILREIGDKQQTLLICFGYVLFVDQWDPFVIDFSL